MSDFPKLNIVTAIRYGMTSELPERPEQREHNMRANGLGAGVFPVPIITKSLDTPEQAVTRARANNDRTFWQSWFRRLK